MSFSSRIIHMDWTNDEALCYKANCVCIQMHMFMRRCSQHFRDLMWFYYDTLLWSKKIIKRIKQSVSSNRDHWRQHAILLLNVGEKVILFTLKNIYIGIKIACFKCCLRYCVGLSTPKDTNVLVGNCEYFIAASPSKNCTCRDWVQNYGHGWKLSWASN